MSLFFHTFLKGLLTSFVYHTRLFWSDKAYIKAMFRLQIGKKLNLKHPQSFNEKIQWLKLYNRKPEYSVMVDKVKAKEYVASIIGEEYIIPTLGVWKDPDEIDFNALPDRFVLKCNHNSGTGMYICKDKSKMDVDKVKSELRKGLRENYFLRNREWPYKDVPRRIIAEKYMEPDPLTKDLSDYKFFCFNGKVKYFKIDFDRFIDHHANYYTPDGKLLPFGEAEFLPKPDKQLVLPSQLKTMISFSERLSKDIPFIRVDFYQVNNNVYFGELTFFPTSGFGCFDPEEYDLKVGEWLQLP